MELNGKNGSVETRNYGNLRKPVQSVRLRTSKDGKKFIIEAVQTWIFPINYVGTIVQNAGKPYPKNGASDEAGLKPVAA